MPFKFVARTRGKTVQFQIAVVQFEISQFEPQENLARAEEFIRQAVAASADLIVFPEDFVFGPLNGRADLADFDGKYVQEFQNLALEYDIDIVPGSIIEGDVSGLYNTTYYIDHSGDILGKYQKVHLWLPERDYITPGEDTCVFDTRFGKVGLIICWDLMFPEMFRAMVEKDVEIVICPSYWCLEDAGNGQKLNSYAEVTLVNALCIARAFENEIVLVYANAAGKTDLDGCANTLIGQSQVTVPFRGPLDIAMNQDEAMFVAEVDTSVLDIAEESYEIRSDLSKKASAPARAGLSEIVLRS